MRHGIALTSFCGSTLIGVLAQAQILETPVSQPTLGAFGTASDSEPAIAGSGSGYLVGWHDSRTGTNRVILNRLDATGHVLDASGFFVNRTAGAQQSVDLVYDGTKYWAVWQDARGANKDIYAARIAVDGTVLDPLGILVSNASGDQTRPKFAFNGQRLLVVWEDTRAAGTLDIYGARIDPTTATVLDPNGIEISRNANSQSAPNATALGTDFYVTWNDANPTAASYFVIAKVSNDGVVDVRGGTPVLATSSTPQYQQIAASSDTLYVAAVTSYSVSIYGISPTNYAVLTPSPLLYTFPSFTRASLALSYGANRLYPAWAQTSSSFSYRGDIIDPSDGPTLVNEHSLGSNGGTTTGLDLTYTGSDFAAAMLNGQRVYASSRTVSGQNSTQNFQTLASPRALPQNNISMAYAAGQFAAAWSEENVGSTSLQIRATRIDEAGTVLDNPSLSLGNTGTSNSVNGTSIAIASGTALVAWADQRSGVDHDVFAVRFAMSNGALLDSQPIYVSTATDNQTLPKLAAGNGQFLAVWNDYRTSWNAVYCSRIGLDGQVLDIAGIRIDHGVSAYVSAPSVTFDGTNYVVGYAASGSLYVQRVTPGGSALYGAAKPIASVASSGGTPPALAQHGDYTIAVWGGTGMYSGDNNVMRYVVFDRNDNIVVNKTYDSSPTYPFRTPVLATNGTVAASLVGTSSNRLSRAYVHGLLDTSTSAPINFDDRFPSGYDYAMAASSATGTILAGYVERSPNNTWGNLRAYFKQIPTSAAGGAGGASGTGGAPGTGGTTSTGGATSTGGTTSTGGATSTGGMGAGGLAGVAGRGQGGSGTLSGGVAGALAAGGFAMGGSATGGVATGAGGASNAGRSSAGGAGVGVNVGGSNAATAGAVNAAGNAGVALTAGGASAQAGGAANSSAGAAIAGGNTNGGANSAAGTGSAFGGTPTSVGGAATQTGGRATTGAPLAGNAGSVGGSEGDPTVDSGEESSGCDCRVVRTRRFSSAALLVALGLLLRRKRR